MVKHSEIKPFHVKQSHIFTVYTDFLLERDGCLDDVITNFLNVDVSSPCNS